jgi:hypothetical protein
MVAFVFLLKVHVAFQELFGTGDAQGKKQSFIYSRLHWQHRNINVSRGHDDAFEQCQPVWIVLRPGPIDSLVHNMNLWMPNGVSITQKVLVHKAIGVRI